MSTGRGVTPLPVAAVDHNGARRDGLAGRIVLEQIGSDDSAGTDSRPSGNDVFLRIADALPVLISYVDATRRYRFNNCLYEQWFGRTPEEIAGCTMREVLGEEAYQVLLPHVDAALSGQPVTFEALVPYREAGPRHIRASYVPDRVDGDVRGFFVLVEDISASKREAARAEILSEATRQFAASTHDLPQLMQLIASRVAAEVGDIAGISMLEPDGELALMSMEHRDPARMSLLREFVEPRTVPTGIVQRVLDEGKPVRLTGAELLNEAQPTSEGSRAYIDRFGLAAALIVPLRLGTDPIGILGLIREAGGDQYSDAEERLAVELANRAALAIHNARMHDEVRVSGERQRALADALPALVVITGANGAIQDFNAAYGEYTGLTLEQARDWQAHEMIHPEDFPPAMDVWETALASGEPMINEMRLRRHDGVYRWHVVRGMPMRSEGGIIERWVTVSVDVHDRKEMEQERERWTEALEKANAAKDEFLGLVSHELRTPITTIFGNAQVLRRNSHLVSEGDRSEALADIEREAERLQRIIENMLVLARVDAGNEMNIEPVRVAPLIEAVTKEHLRRYPARDVQVEIAPDIGIAAAERTYLELVLRNLLGNAEKYTPRGGTLRLSARRNGASIMIAVRDQCGGLGEGEEEAIFGVFYRSPRSAHLAAGTGIGLAVCKRLVEAQHGTIGARTLPGEGCEIAFTIPLEQPIDDD